MQLVQYSHPNVVQILDIFDQSNMLLIVQEFCCGGSLYELMVEKKTFTELEAIDIIHQVSKGIQFLHSNSIVHRDIKPENVLRQIVDGHESYKITDFGLSAATQTNERMTTVKVGTAYYVAPEILDGHGYDKSVDIWALGLMFDELLHGTPFYNGNSEEEVFKKIRHDPFIIRNKKYYDHQDDRKTIIQHILIGMIERDPIKRRDLTWILQQIDLFKKPRQVVRNPSPLNQSILSSERNLNSTNLSKTQIFTLPTQNPFDLLDMDANDINNCPIHHIQLMFKVPQLDKVFSCCIKCLQQYGIFENNDYQALINQALQEFQTKGFDYFYKASIFQKELQLMIDQFTDSNFVIIQKDFIFDKYSNIGNKFCKLARQEFIEQVEKIRNGFGQDFIAQSLKLQDNGGLNRISQNMGLLMSKFRKDAIKECEQLLRQQLLGILNYKLESQ